MRTITPEQWIELATRLNVEVAALKAVAEVESAGSGFLTDGRPKILFEGHVFSRLTKRVFDRKHPKLSFRKWTKKHYLGGAREWSRLNAARELDFDAANQATSWGAFQILGLNYREAGFMSTSAFVTAMQAGVAEQLGAFAEFIAREPYLSALRDHDWARFARAYNGPGYALNAYDIKLAKAYAKHDGATIISKTNNTTPIGRPAEPKKPARKRSANVRPDPIDLRDFIYRAPVSTRPPAELLPSAARVRHQGDSFGCTGFALATVIERLIDRASPNRVDPVSPWMLYALARRYDEFVDDPSDDAGSSLRGALKAWSRHGASAEVLWPKMSEPKRKITKGQSGSDWWNDAVRRPLGAYYRIDTRQIIDLQLAILETGAVYASVFSHPGWNQLDQTRAKPFPGDAKSFPLIAQVKVSEQSGHAIALVGYCDDGFIIQNSYGPRFGAGGYAILRYADWLANAMDAWVVQIGVVTSERRAIAQRDGLRMQAGNVQLSGERHLQTHELSSYVINFGNNGQLSARGHFSTNEDDLRELCEILIPKARIDFGLKPTDTLPIALFAHGGLVGERSAESGAKDWIPFLYERGVFPIYIAWESGLFNSILGSIEDQFRDDDESPTAAIARSKKLRRNWLIEKFVRHIIGRNSWREMKENATLIAQTAYRRKDGNPVGLAALWRAMHNARKTNASSIGPASLHLIGHSAGTTLMTALMQRLLGPARAQEWHPPVRSFSSIAGAVRSDVFWPAMTKWQQQGFDPSRILLAHLTEGAENADKAGPYKGSLLYLIARALEDDDPTPLLGLAECTEPELALRQLGIRVITSPSKIDGNVSTTATAHGALDNDDVLQGRVVGHVRGVGE